MRNKLAAAGLIVAAVCLAGIIQVQAQTEKFHSSVGINLKASNNGFGGDLYYRPFKTLALKAGYETVNLPFSQKVNQDNVELDAKFHYNTGATSLCAVYQPFGGLYFTAGAAFLDFKSSLHGVSSGAYEIGDISVPAEKLGEMNIRITPQNKIAPYAGFGIGNAFPRDYPVSFSLEIGAFYMGSPKIDIQATGMLAPNADPDHIATLQNEIKDFKLYPVVKLSLGIRLYTFGKEK